VRWVGVDDPKVAIATYDLDRHGVLHSPPYLAIGRDNLSPWSRRMIGKAKRLLRIEAEQLVPGDQVMRGTTQYLVLVASNVKPEAQADVREWYAKEHIPNLAGVPGTVSARFFHSLGGTHNHIALYEIETVETCASAAWKQAIDTPWSERMRPHLGDKLRLVLKRYVKGGA
jgi:hypothetical protein